MLLGLLWVVRFIWARSVYSVFLILFCIAGLIRGLLALLGLFCLFWVVKFIGCCLVYWELFGVFQFVMLI